VVGVVLDGASPADKFGDVEVPEEVVTGELGIVDVTAVVLTGADGVGIGVAAVVVTIGDGVGIGVADVVAVWDSSVTTGARVVAIWGCSVTTGACVVAI